MALSINTIWEVRTTGADTNGGGFAYGVGTKTVNGSATLAVDATNQFKVTSSAHNFVSGDVGKYLQVTAGTGWVQGYYQVVGVVSNAAILSTLGVAPTYAGNSNYGTYSLFDGIDYSQQDTPNSGTPNKSTTDASATGTTTLTSATASFTTAISGNAIYLSGGGLTTGWYTATYASATTVTLDRTPGTGSSATMNIGGALASPGNASSIMAAPLLIFIRNVGLDGASVYSITTTSAGPGGPITTLTGNCVIQGYTTNRTVGNSDARPTLQLAVASCTLFQGTYYSIQGLICDGNNQTAAVMASNAGMLFVNCLFQRFTTAGSGSNSNTFYYCIATNNTGIVFAGSSFFCESYSNSNAGFSDMNVAIGCISYNNSGANGYGFLQSSDNIPMEMISCVSYGNSQDGIFFGSTARPSIISNTHCEANGGYGFNTGAGTLGTGRNFRNCSSYNNASGDFGPSFASAMENIGFIKATGSVFVNAASGNFALNRLAGQGALLRAAADPQLFPRGLTSSYEDIGVAQHKDQGGTPWWVS